jgi:tyrosine-protein kinase Etk/Wzc
MSDMSQRSRPEFDQEGRPPKTVGESLLDFFSIVVQWRRFIVWTVLLSTLITGIVTFLLPKWYKSTCSVFPAEQTDLLGGLDGVSSLVKSFSSSKKLGALGGANEVDRYVAILKSNTVLGAVIEKFDLVSVYEMTDSPYKMEKTAKELESNTELEVQDEGNLVIAVYDRDPQRAADMANYYVELLNRTNSELKVQNARGNRMFVEQRYQKNLDDIRRAEDAMKTFQLKHGVIAMPEQTEASIKAGAEVAARLALKEIELGVMRRTLSEDHPGIKAAENEIDAIRGKIRDMNTGASGNPDDMKILVPFRQTPELGIQYIRLFREAEIQYKILQFITPLYEQSKVEEQRNTPSVVVLDRAFPAERKSKPKVSLYALLALVISTVVALFITFVAVGLERLKILDPVRFNSIGQAVRSDWFGLKKFPDLRRKRD